MFSKKCFHTLALEEESPVTRSGVRQRSTTFTSSHLLPSSPLCFDLEQGWQNDFPPSSWALRQPASVLLAERSSSCLTPVPRLSTAASPQTLSQDSLPPMPRKAWWSAESKVEVERRAKQRPRFSRQERIPTGGFISSSYLLSSSLPPPSTLPYRLPSRCTPSQCLSGPRFSLVPISPQPYSRPPTSSRSSTPCCCSMLSSGTHKMES